MADDLEILILVLKETLNSSLASTDPDLLLLPRRQDCLDANVIRRRKHTGGLSNGRLVFAMLACDGHVRPHPPIRRAMELVKNVLRKHGHEIVE